MEDAMKTIVGWEPTENGKFYVVEYGGMLKTGPFKTKEGAQDWFRNELDREIYFEEECNGDEKTEEGTSQAACGDTPEKDEKTETWVSHCPGCASADR